MTTSNKLPIDNNLNEFQYVFNLFNTLNAFSIFNFEQIIVS